MRKEIKLFLFHSDSLYNIGPHIPKAPDMKYHSELDVQGKPGLQDNTHPQGIN